MANPEVIVGHIFTFHRQKVKRQKGQTTKGLKTQGQTTKGQTKKGQTTKGQNDKNIFLFESLETRNPPINFVHGSYMLDMDIIDHVAAALGLESVLTT